MDNGKMGNKNIVILIALFLTVVLLGAFTLTYIRFYRNTQDNLIHATEDKLTLISDQTNSFLQKAKSVVASEAATVEYIMEEGQSNQDILNYLLYQTDFQLAGIDSDFTGLYGYYRGEYLDGNRWDPYADGGEYFPKKRPWYLAAAVGKGRVSVASPYLDMDTGNIVLSITKLLSDGESVLGMDISLKNLSVYVNEYLAENSFRYAYIIDNVGTIVASRNAEETGLNYLMENADSDTHGMAEMFRQALKTDKHFDYVIDGSRQMVLSKTIENNWQVIAVTDADSVLSPLRRTAVLCIILLAALIGLLVFFALSSIRDNKKTVLAQQSEQKYIRELQDTAGQLSTYKLAILSDALISLEVNLTRGLLYYGVWKDDEGKTVPLPQIIGMELPCSYNDYITAWRKKFVISDSGDPFSDNTDMEHLLSEYARGRSEVTFDYEALTISGRRTWLRRSICMTRNRNGDVIAYTNVKDISALVEQTKREEAYIRALAMEYDSIAVVGFRDDEKDDTIVLHSRIDEGFAALLDEQTIGENNFVKRMELLAGFIHPDDREQFLADVRRARLMESFAANRTHAVDFRIIKKDGDFLYYQVRFIPLRDEDGQVRATIICLRNTDGEVRKEMAVRETLEKSRAAAEAANRAKSAFLFNMSHDIRTPMNAIIGFTEMARKYPEDHEKVESCLEKVASSSRHLLGLINDVLDMARIESGKMNLEEKVINIREASRPAMAIACENAKNRGLELTLHSGPVGDVWIWGDELKISQIALNIISNSIKYTNPGGKVDIWVTEVPGGDPERLLCDLIVQDTGIGMSEEFLAKVFEPFERSANSTASGVQGTGLGMAITKQLVEKMGGTIWVESKLGEGTRVTVRFNFLRAEAPGKEDAVQQTAGADSRILKGKKVLLTEDNELNREIAADILEEEGMIVDTAEDGDIAVEKVRSGGPGRYDLILMDIQMPRMNGYEAARAIRALPDSGVSGIPIIAMTANAFDEDRQNAFAAGMNDHISKPIDVEKLKEAMKKILK